MARPDALDPRAFLRELSLISAVIALIAAGVATAAGQLLLARSIILGVSVGLLHFMLLARSISAALRQTAAGAQRMMSQRNLRNDEGAEGAEGAEGVEGVEPSEVVDRAYGVGYALRSLLVIGLVVVGLWFLGADPVGIAGGVILVLAVSSVTAARQHRSAR